jgi:hypothetical protein
MSISLLGAVKAVPWGDVIAAAPSVVQGANALWDRVAKKRPKGEAAGASAPVPADASADARLAALEQALAELQKEALASSQLIRSLAEQNVQLVREVEVLRLRSRIVMGAAVVFSVVLAASFYFAIAGR